MRILVRSKCKEHLFLLQKEIQCQRLVRLYMWMSRIVGKDCVESTFSVVVRRVNVVT